MHYWNFSLDHSSEPSHSQKGQKSERNDKDDNLNVKELEENLPSTSAAGGSGDGPDGKNSEVSVGKPVAQTHPELMRIMQETIDGRRRGQMLSDSSKTHQFWSTQPVPKYGQFFEFSFHYAPLSSGFLFCMEPFTLTIQGNPVLRFR